MEFAPEAPVLLVGGDDGIIQVMRVEGVDVINSNKWGVEEQEQRLLDLLEQDESQRLNAGRS